MRVNGYGEDEDNPEKQLLTLLKSRFLRLVGEELVQLFLVGFRELADVDLAGVHLVVRLG